MRTATRSAPFPPTVPLLDFALDLARGSSGQVRELLVLSQGVEEGSFVVIGQACSPVRGRKARLALVKANYKDDQVLMKIDE